MFEMEIIPKWKQEWNRNEMACEVRRILLNLMEQNESLSIDEAMKEIIVIAEKYKDKF